ncbi:MAG: hypothetical protein AMS17_01960 [Spirochaetes bacterium DG_61]|nr:MAG: hypothetical protein AMS17_01960 [Spirochaetes bacterium DG_61]
MMDAKEKRKFDRIPNNDLPKVFKNLFVDIGKYKHMNAKTADVSTRGVGVFLSVPQEIVGRNDKVVMHSSDDQHEFTGQIANIKKLQEDYYRLGVSLKVEQ